MHAKVQPTETYKYTPIHTEQYPKYKTELQMKKIILDKNMTMLKNSFLINHIHLFIIPYQYINSTF